MVPRTESLVSAIGDSLDSPRYRWPPDSLFGVSSDGERLGPNSKRSGGRIGQFCLLESPFSQHLLSTL